MPTIYYECSEPRTAYRIDEVSQELLAYLSTYGPATLHDMMDSVDVDSEDAQLTRITDSVGPDAANLVIQADKRQKTIDGNDTVVDYALTDLGENFVWNNKSSLSTSQSS